jgi:hypothetical protein
MHLGLGCRPDPMKMADRQSFDKDRPLRWRDPEQAVGLVLDGGKLGQELVVAHARRGGQTRLGRIRARISSAIWVADAIPFRFSVTSR